MKDEIQAKLNDYIQRINSSFSVVDTMGSLSLIYTKSRYVISDFRFYSKDNFTVYGFGGDYARYSLDVIEAFHDKAVELLEQKAPKYTVQVIKDSEWGYLNLDLNEGDYTVDDKNNGGSYQTHFTKSEIENLKKNNDLAIDWDKAVIEEVER